MEMEDVPLGNVHWLPRSLKLLFGKPLEAQELGAADCHSRCRTAWSEEALYMQLLQQEEEEEMLDDGAK